MSKVYQEVQECCWVGIDPGESGGIASITGRQRPGLKFNPNKLKVHVYPCPKTDFDFLKILGELPSLPTFACLEQVGGFIRFNGKNVAAAHTTFVLGGNYRAWKMALICNEIRFETVLPARWQSRLNIEPKRKQEDQASWKRRLKVVAEEYFPNIKITLKTCDALLIALYGYLTKKITD